MSAPEKRALGRGLAALIPEVRISSAVRTEQIEYLSTDKVNPSKYQPRQEFDPEKHKDLVASIKEKGVVQPILVRSNGDSYELIAGERRLRAAKELGMAEIPAIVKDVSDLDVLELSLIENIQREDLNPLEQAHAYQRLMDEFQFTHESISQVIGKDRTTISNTLRLLALPQKVQDFILNGSITMAHAKALLSIKSASQQVRLCERVVRKGLSVKELETLIIKTAKGFIGSRVKKGSEAKDSSILAIEEELQHLMGTKVRVHHGKKRGKIEIEYYSNDDLNRILQYLKKS